VTIALRRPIGAALARRGANRRRELGLDQLLQGSREDVT
jgi:hypothetical protein